MLAAGTGGVRLLRALAFVATVVLVTVVGHEWAGGSASPAGIVALGALCWPVALIGSARQRRLRHIFPALTIGQLVGHGILTFFSGAATTTLMCTGAAADHVHALTPGCLQAASSPVVAVHGEAGLAGTTGMAGMTAMPGALMLLGHLAAALLLAVLLRHGESLLWRIVDAVVRRGAPQLARLRTAPRVGAFHSAEATHRHLVLVVPGRGPPALAA